MGRHFLFFSVAFFATVAVVLSTTSAPSACPEVLAKIPSGAQPIHDTLHEAAWDNDADSLCLLLQQPDAHVNLKSDKWVLLMIFELAFMNLAEPYFTLQLGRYCIA
jgi:hypothetical protein